jgi:hypothetical protein
VSDVLDIPSKEAASTDDPGRRKWGYGKGEVWADEDAKWHECGRYACTE